jgi:hypothetical protein
MGTAGKALEFLFAKDNSEWIMIEDAGLAFGRLA